MIFFILPFWNSYQICILEESIKKKILSAGHLFDFYQVLKEDNMSFVYQGQFDDSITEKLLMLSEFNISNSEEVRKLRKKVSFIMIESFQNIVRHGDKPKAKGLQAEYPSIFFLSNRGKAVYVTSINIIGNEHIPELKRKLERVNTLSKEELKELFSKIMMEEAFSDKGGAGLGLIEMARKSGESVDYDFEELSDTKSNCLMRFKLKGADEEGTVEYTPLADVKTLHNQFRNENILMLYKGDFSHEAVVPVIQMMEQNMKQLVAEVGSQKRIFNVLVEVLQNISRHGDLNPKGKKHGLFMIGKTDEGFAVYAGNLIKNKKVAEVKTKLSKLAELNSEELHQLYRTTLRKERISTDSGAGLGLIDIFRDSNGGVGFDFRDTDNDQTFYSIAVNI